MSRDAMAMLAKLFIGLLLVMVFWRGCSSAVFQNFVDYWYFSGQSYEESGDYAKAVEKYRQVLAWDKRGPYRYQQADRAAVRIASIEEEKLYQFDEAKQGYLDMIRLYPHSPLRAQAEDGVRRCSRKGEDYRRLWRQADEQMTRGKYKEAVEAYRGILAVVPQDSAAQLKLKESQALVAERMTKEQAVSMISIFLKSQGRELHRVAFTTYWVQSSQSYRDAVLIDIPVTAGRESAAVWDAVRACLQLLKHRFSFDLGKLVVRENAGGRLNPESFQAYTTLQVHEVSVESLRAFNEGWKTQAEIMEELKVK